MRYNPGSFGKVGVPWKQRLWSRTTVSESGCLLWDGSTNACGYGNLTKHPQVGTLAHRIAWFLAFGPIPEGQCVCHRCDTPACINPIHLFLGSHADNMADMVNKGRAHKMRGESSPRARLTADQVREIRRLYAKGETQVALSEAFDTPQTNVSRIVRREAWKTI